ncbi:MAG: class I SAM-dependent methyltransferase [Hyphomicrobiales bacterium]|nr:class I SAM-dependent methyltransferase [Hyphomicrobiales bacterium]
MTTVHHAASEGFAAHADAYARGRPEYPPQAVDWLRETLRLAPGKTAVDLGSGTGKFLNTLRQTGADMVAVEPVAAMREQLLQKNSDVQALEGTAEAIPLPDASVDAVVCAQAFHWFANPRAMSEIRRVLKKGGALGLIWNVRDESVPWVRAITAIITPHEGDAPRYHTGKWREAFPAEGFGPLAQTRFPWRHRGPPDNVIVDRTCSSSFIAALPPAEHRSVAEALRALIAGTPALAGRAEVEYPYVTEAFAASKIG